MKITADRNIPFIERPLRAIGDLVMLPGTEITPEVMADTDILLTRTRTRCNEALLAQSPCSFIGTATIGTDHIDLPYCRECGITVANAPGCNAPAVAQWVLAAVINYFTPARRLSDITLGVIGAGHVGSILIRWAEGLGIRVLVNDPLLQETAPDAYNYSTLADIARKCDVISVHTPLTRDGRYPSYHFIGSGFISMLRRKPLILNAARGPVTDTRALIEGLDSGQIGAVGIDCWEGEPAIDPILLERAYIATPHIAGYSRQGKIRASEMVLDALSQHLGLTTPLRADAPSIPPVPDTITEEMISYDILADTEALKSAPADFEALRNNYHLREEPYR